MVYKAVIFHANKPIFSHKRLEKIQRKNQEVLFFFFGIISLFLVKNELQGIIQVSWAECDFQLVVSYFFRSAKMVLRRHIVYQEFR